MPGELPHGARGSEELLQILLGRGHLPPVSFISPLFYQAAAAAAAQA